MTDSSRRTAKAEPVADPVARAFDPQADRATVTRDRWILFVLGAFLFLPGIGARDLWNPDEPRYADVARTMLETGEYLVPQLNGAVYAHKPPLLFWLMAAGGAARGTVDEVAARLPSACAAILAVLCVYGLGLRLFERRTALLSALVFASTWKILWQAHVGQIDMLLTAWVVAAMLFWVRSRVEERPGLIWGFWICTGFATLAKGPVGLLPPLLAILVHLALERDRQAVRDLRIGRGLLLWAAVVLAWLGPAILLGGQDYMREILFKQNVTRYVDPWHHLKPVYYYLTVLPGDFAPWFYALPAALFASWRSLRGQERRHWRWLLAWVVVTLIFFSVSPAKRTVYILTMYPALALLVGRGLALLAEGSALGRRWLLAPTAALAALGVVVVGAVAILGPQRPEVAPLTPDVVPWTIAALAAATLGLLVALAFWSRRRILRGTMAVALGMAGFALVCFTQVLPRLDPVKSARALATTLDHSLPPGVAYGIHPWIDPTFLYYAKGHRAIDLEMMDDLEAFLAQDEPYWVLIERDDWDALATRPELYEIARDADVTDGYLLLTNAPGAIAGLDHCGP